MDQGRAGLLRSSMHKLWSTDTVEVRDRLSYWIEAVCQTYVQLDCGTPLRDRLV